MALSSDRIPTIDVSDRSASDAAIGRAVEVCGFMRVRGHGIDPAIVDAAFDATRRLFALPEAEKLAMKDRGSDRGYHPMFDNLREDGRPSGQEGWTMGHPVPPVDPSVANLPFHAPTPWPALDGFRPALETLYDAMFALGRDLLAAIARHLGADERFFDAAAQDTYSHLRLNHYPPQEAVAHVAEEGVFAHVDESLLTLLFQDANGGLQVRGRDGLWIPVEPDAGAVVVNVGRMLTHWTGGRCNAALHRVINRSGRDRYSIPLFMHPGFRTVVDPVALVGRATDAYPPIVAGDAVSAVFAATRQSWKDAAAAERATT